MKTLYKKLYVITIVSLNIIHTTTYAAQNPYRSRATEQEPLARRATKTFHRPTNRYTRPESIMSQEQLYAQIKLLNREILKLKEDKKIICLDIKNDIDNARNYNYRLQAQMDNQYPIQGFNSYDFKHRDDNKSHWELTCCAVKSLINPTDEILTDRVINHKTAVYIVSIITLSAFMAKALFFAANIGQANEIKAIKHMIKKELIHALMI